MTEAPSRELDTLRPFTRADALAAGISPAMLRGSRFRRIFRNVYVDERVARHPLVRTAASTLTQPSGAFASHHSAARLLGLPVPDTPDEHVSVFHASDRRHRPGIACHVAPPGTPVTNVRGVRASTPLQTFLDLAGVLSLVDLVVVGDALVRLGMATAEQLRQACRDSTTPGRCAARAAAAYVRDGVDSPMETRLRMLLVLAGLPEPTVNHELYDGQGRLRYRFDLSYPELRLIVEYDGRQHREDLDQWDHDIDRREWFDRNGWTILPVVARGIYRRPDQTIARVHRALADRGCTTLPARLSDAWRPHFPVRR